MVKKNIRKWEVITVYFMYIKEEKYNDIFLNTDFLPSSKGVSCCLKLCSRKNNYTIFSEKIVSDKNLRLALYNYFTEIEKAIKDEKEKKKPFAYIGSNNSIILFSNNSVKKIIKNKNILTMKQIFNIDTFISDYLLYGIENERKTFCRCFTKYYSDKNGFIREYTDLLEHISFTNFPENLSGTTLQGYLVQENENILHTLKSNFESCIQELKKNKPYFMITDITEYKNKNVSNLPTKEKQKIIKYITLTLKNDKIRKDI